MRSLKIFLVIVLISAFLGGFITPLKAEITTVGTYAIGAWLLNFFTSQPQRWQTSAGTFEVRIEVPQEFRGKLAGVKYLYPLNHENQLVGQGQILRLIAGWSTQVSAFFPTGEREVRKAYWRVDNGAVKGEFDKAPYRFDLPFLTDVANSHFIEIGVGTGRNSGGSIFAMYRCNTLEGYYAEFMANQQFASLTRDEFVKKIQTAAQPSPSPIAEPEQSGSVRIQLLDPERPKEGKVKIKLILPSKEVRIGTFSVGKEGMRVTKIAVGSILMVQPEGYNGWIGRREFKKAGEAEIIQLKKKGVQ